MSAGQETSDLPRYSCWVQGCPGHPSKYVFCKGEQLPSNLRNGPPFSACPDCGLPEIPFHKCGPVFDDLTNCVSRQLDEIERLTRELAKAKAMPMKYRRMEFNAQLQGKIDRLTREHEAERVRWQVRHDDLSVEITRLTRELEARSPIIDAAHRRMLQQDNERLDGKLTFMENGYRLVQSQKEAADREIERLTALLAHERCIYQNGAKTSPVDSHASTEVNRLRAALGETTEWVNAALHCKTWHWDTDQYDAALGSYQKAKQLLAGMPADEPSGDPIVKTIVDKLYGV